MKRKKSQLPEESLASSNIFVFLFPTPSDVSFSSFILPFRIGLHVLFHESRLENSVLDLPQLLFKKLELHCGQFEPLRNSENFVLNFR